MLRSFFWERCCVLFFLFHPTYFIWRVRLRRQEPPTFVSISILRGGKAKNKVRAKKKRTNPKERRGPPCYSPPKEFKANLILQTYQRRSRSAPPPLPPVPLFGDQYKIATRLPVSAGQPCLPCLVSVIKETCRPKSPPASCTRKRRKQKALCLQLS